MSKTIHVPGVGVEMLDTRRWWNLGIWKGDGGLGPNRQVELSGGMKFDDVELLGLNSSVRHGVPIMRHNDIVNTKVLQQPSVSVNTIRCHRSFTHTRCAIR